MLRICTEDTFCFFRAFLRIYSEKSLTFSENFIEYTATRKFLFAKI